MAKNIVSKNVNLLDHAPSFAIRALARLLSPFEDPIGTERPRWASSSRYQKNQNFVVQAANGVFCNTFRCIAGDYYTDPYFAQNWSLSDGVLPHRAGYGVLNPAYSVASTWARWKLNQPEIDIIPRVIDLELSEGQPAAVIASKTWELSERIADHDGIRPIIYSRRLLIRDWLIPYWSSAQIESHWYYLAQYLYDRVREHPGPPDVVPGLPIERVILHQAADLKPALPGETETGTITWDRWDLINEGDFDEMVAFIAREFGSEPEPPPGPDPEIEEIKARLTAVENKAAENERQIALIWDLINQQGASDLPYYDAVVTGVKAVAFAASQFNAKGRPVIDINAHTATGDPALKWNTGDRLKVYPVEIVADGGKVWYVLYGVPMHDYSILFVDPDDLEFVVL